MISNFFVGRQKQIAVIQNNVEIIGKADTRIFPFDSVKRLPRRAPSSGYQDLNYAKPAVPLPVVYEDEHMAIGKMSRNPFNGFDPHTLKFCLSISFSSQQTFGNDLSFHLQRWFQRQLSP